MWGVAIRLTKGSFVFGYSTGSKHQVNKCFTTLESQHMRETLLEWLDGYSEVNLGEVGWMHLIILTIHGLIKKNAYSNQVFRHLPKATKKDILLDSLCKTLQ